MFSCSLIVFVWLHLFTISKNTQALQYRECTQDKLDKSYVTECSTTLCEPLLEKEADQANRLAEWPETKSDVVHIVSSRISKIRFKVNHYKSMENTAIFYEEAHFNATIFVNPNVKYQKILGFGSTLTDASCKNIDDLPDNIRSSFISDYFNIEEGIGLNLIKVPIGSTKYSYTNYVLDEPDANQVELSPYDIDNRIPFIRDVLKVAGKSKNRVRIIASSATAPADYKTNKKITDGGSLKDDKVGSYASYLSSFISAYRAQGFNVWALILSDQPVSVGLQKAQMPAGETLEYNSMTMKPSETIKLINSIHTLQEKQPDSSKFRLLLLGDNRAFIPVWADAVFQSPDSGKKVAGISYVCDAERASPYDSLSYAIKRYPSKYLLATGNSINSPVKLGNWQYAENYATEISKNLEHGSVGWIDSNLALDIQGGPCLSDDYRADAPMIVDAKRKGYYRNPMLYAIGHFSRYIKPGSTRIKLKAVIAPHTYTTQQVAFLTPDNYIVVVVLNNNIGPIPISIGIDTVTKVETLLETKSFNTFIFRN